MAFVVIIALMVLMFFFMSRKQRQQMKAQQDMINNATVGAEVVTRGGMYGTIVSRDESTITLEVSPDVRITFAAGAIAQVRTPGLEPVNGDNAPTFGLSEQSSVPADETPEQTMERLRQKAAEAKANESGGTDSK